MLELEMKEIWHQKGISEVYIKAEVATRRPGSSLIAQAGLTSKTPTSSNYTSTNPLRIFDNACGTAIISVLLCDELEFGNREDCEILAGDLSIEMVESTRERMKGLGWKNVKAEVIDSQDTKLPSSYFDHVITNFGIFLVNDPAKTLVECIRITKPKGVISFSCWESLGWCQTLTDALARIPNAPFFGDIREILWGKTGAWHDLSIVRTAAETSGLVDVRVVTLAFYSMHTSPRDYINELSGFVDRMKWLLPKGKGDPLRDPLLKEMRELLEERHGKKSFGVPLVAILCSGSKELEER